MNALTPITAPSAIDAERFISQFYQPADTATEATVEALRVMLGLPNRINSREAICGWLVALQSLMAKGDVYLGWPHNKDWYERGRDVWKTCRERLVTQGFLELARKGFSDATKGSSSVTVYYVVKFPAVTWDELKFKQTPPKRLVTVRKYKSKYIETTDQEMDGHVLSEKQCDERFGDEYTIAKMRISALNRILVAHPFEIDGKTYQGLQRKFNNGCLDRGGRFYAGYCSLPKEKMNKETGEHLCRAGMEVEAHRHAGQGDGARVA